MGYREVVINKRTRPSFDELLCFEINEIPQKYLYHGRCVIIARPPHYFPRQLHAIRLLFRRALYMGYRKIVIHNGTRLSFDEL